MSFSALIGTVVSTATSTVVAYSTISALKASQFCFSFPLAFFLCAGGVFSPLIKYEYSTHFLDMCVLAGFDYASTYAPLLEGRTFTFDAAVQLVKRHRAGVYAVQQRQTSSQHGATVDWLKKFLVTYKLFSFQFINLICI